MPDRICRCGAELGDGVGAMIDHVLSQEHAANLEALGIAEHTHSWRYVDDAGHPVSSYHPQAKPYVSDTCPGCIAEAGNG